MTIPHAMPIAADPACASCGGRHLHQIMDFGDVALAGGFLKPDQFDTEMKYRLRLHFCADCYLVQVVDVVDARTLFGNYFYHSSFIRTLREHFADYATEVVSRFIPNPSQATVVEFGCNDGVLLVPLAAQGIKNAIGVDPAANVTKAITDPRVKVISDFFSVPTAKRIEAEFGGADLICANNVFAHIPDLNGVTAAVETLLKPDGVFIFEVHYLGRIIDNFQYDMVYHEHLYYYSLLAVQKLMARFGMMVFDVKPVATHAGSMRYYVARADSVHAANVTSRVTALADEETERGYNRVETFLRFAADVESRKVKLMALLNHLKGLGRSVAGYGASGRANTVLQYCGITDAHLDFMVDDSTAKQGYYTPGSHLPILAKEALLEKRPDYTVVFAWSFFNEIADRNVRYLDEGGKMIVPLPDVRMISHPDIFKDSL